MPAMKIVTYNVNGISARLPNLLRWLARSQPDVVCLQELKAPQEKFPEAAIREAGYGVIWHGQKSWNGVAILARGTDPVEIRRVLPGDPEDLHSRYIEATVQRHRRRLPVPAQRQPRPGAQVRLQAAAGWSVSCRTPPNLLERLARRAGGRLQRDTHRADVYKPERWVDDALFRTEVRETFARLLAQGWTDAIRELHPDEKIYTFWDFFRNAYGRDAGLRIDHLLLNPALAGRLTAAGVDREVRGWERPSDHAPTWVALRD